MDNERNSLNERKKADLSKRSRNRANHEDQEIEEHEESEEPEFSQKKREVKRKKVQKTATQSLEVSKDARSFVTERKRETLWSKIRKKGKVPEDSQNASKKVKGGRQKSNDDQDLFSLFD
jgi:hypothetical protein